MQLAKEIATHMAKEAMTSPAVEAARRKLLAAEIDALELRLIEQFQRRRADGADERDQAEFNRSVSRLLSSISERLDKIETAAAAEASEWAEGAAGPYRCVSSQSVTSAADEEAVPALAANGSLKPPSTTSPAPYAKDEAEREIERKASAEYLHRVMDNQRDTRQAADPRFGGAAQKRMTVHQQLDEIEMRKRGKA